MSKSFSYVWCDATLNKTKHHFLINGGYGKIKGTTFRISNMGNETVATMQELIDAMDDVLAQM